VPGETLISLYAKPLQCSLKSRLADINARYSLRYKNSREITAKVRWGYGSPHLFGDSTEYVYWQQGPIDLDKELFHKYIVTIHCWLWITSIQPEDHSGQVISHGVLGKAMYSA
jgi:hypothetical protein